LILIQSTVSSLLIEIGFQFSNLIYMELMKLREEGAVLEVMTP